MAASLQDRVKARLAALDINAFEAARRGAFDRYFVNDIVKGKKKSVKIDSLARLAIALQTSAAYLSGESDVDQPPEEVTELFPIEQSLIDVLVVGKVEAGAFREVDDYEDMERVVIQESRDRDFPRARVMAFDVAGDSMNALKPRPILPGDRIVAISYEDVAHALPLRDGMTVVVERVTGGGHMREWSVKQLELYEDRIEFHPRSTNPRHKAIVIPRNSEADDGQIVNIMAIVRKISNDVPLS